MHFCKLQHFCEVSFKKRTWCKGNSCWVFNQCLWLPFQICFNFCSISSRQKVTAFSILVFFCFRINFFAPIVVYSYSHSWLCFIGVQGALCFPGRLADTALPQSRCDTFDTTPMFILAEAHLAICAQQSRRLLACFCL